MSDVQNQSGPGRKGLTLAIWGVVLVGVAAVLYVMGSAAFKPADAGNMLAFRKGELSKLEIPGELTPSDPRYPDLEPMVTPPGEPVPGIEILGPDGDMVRLSDRDYRGKVLVVNLWATWCAPCKVEMPTLAALQAAYAAQPVEVIAISTDSEKDLEKARMELARTPPLKFYFSPDFTFSSALQPAASDRPTTIVYDKQGIERARLRGEADWNSREARALVEALLAEG